MIKTYALLDVIGIRRAFANGGAAKQLRRFWQAAEVWTTGGGNDSSRLVRILGRPDVCQAPKVYVVTHA